MRSQKDLSPAGFTDVARLEVGLAGRDAVAQVRRSAGLAVQFTEVDAMVFRDGVVEDADAAVLVGESDADPRPGCAFTRGVQAVGCVIGLLLAVGCSRCLT
jgi:hypothetical protein